MEPHKLVFCYYILAFQNKQKTAGLYKLQFRFHTMEDKGGSNETLDNLEQECGTYFQFFLRPPLLLDKKSVRPPLTNGQKKVDPPNSKK